MIIVSYSLSVAKNRNLFSKGCRQKQTNSIFKDIVQMGGREVTPKLRRNDFLTKVGEGGGHKTYFEK